MAESTPYKNGSQAQAFRNCHDLSQLEEITLENVLECLLDRYSASLYYTFAGQMLISLNPCLHGPRKPIGDVKELKKFEEQWLHTPGRASNGNSDCNGRSRSRSPSTTLFSFVDNQNQKPHIFRVGENCLKSLLSVGNNQVIIVSGDSGAGKTTAIQQLLQYFISKNESLRHLQTPNGLDKKICFATSILESLGNASTTANSNSSRFGRFVQLNYEPTYGSIIGASISTCLLEKHRVSKCEPNERNFHIFYYVLYGLEAEFQLSNFVDTTMMGPEYENDLDLVVENLNWKELIPAYFVEAMKKDDAEEFLALHRSLRSLGLIEEMTRVFRVVFGLMVLLGVKFELEPEDEDEEDPSFDSREFTVHRDSALSLQVAAVVFGLEPDDLLEAFVARKIVAGGGGARARRKSVFRKPCESVQECSERMAAFTSSLYDAVFDYVLARVNSMLKLNPDAYDEDFGDGSSSSSTTLSLLDLYGFENLDVNHLEQLCINYANERLHKVYLQQLRAVRDEMEHCQEVKLSTVLHTHAELDRIEQESTERLDCLHSLLFRALNEECLLNRATTAAVGDKELYERLAASSAVTGQGRQGQGSKYTVFRRVYDETCPFIIRHYASDVQYQLKGMVRKNADYVPPEFGDLLRSSHSFWVRALVKPSDAVAVGVGTPGSSSKISREKTVLHRFKSDVDGLVSVLLENGTGQDLHFIKCIRPSDSLLPASRVNPAVVQRQLYSAGIVDAIKIVGNGLPIRVPKQKFVHMFQGLHFRLDVDGMASLPLPEALHHGQLQLTSTHVCMSEAVWSHFKELNEFVRRRSARLIAEVWLLRRLKKLEQQRVAALAGALAAAKAKPVMTAVQHQRSVEVEDYAYASSREREREPRTSRSLAPGKKSFTDAVRELRPYFRQLNLGVDDNLITRGQVYRGPKHFFTAKSMLPFANVVPRHLRTRGLEELFL